MIRKQWPAFVLAFVLPLLLVYWWWGGFSKVAVTETESGPHFYAYLEHVGDLGKLPKTQARVFALLEQAGITPGDTITVLLTDPRKTPKSEQRAKTGYSVPLDAKLPRELMSEAIPRRKVLSATVRAVVTLAPSRPTRHWPTGWRRQAMTSPCPPSKSTGPQARRYGWVN